MTVERLTDGAFTRTNLVLSAAVGVGAGIALGVIRLILGWPLVPLLLLTYALALGLTAYSSDLYIAIAWDTAGVTTGSVTVPLVLALGLGLVVALERADGFGILSTASVGPIVSVLARGLCVEHCVARRAP